MPTDGQPNEGPKEGEVAALRALKAQNEKALSGLTISTFGMCTTPAADPDVLRIRLRDQQRAPP